ncbi:MAG: hypothetical protein IJ848_03595, partial [Alphaproteobacteria bacterium]|nr:hypothetical protein [Alphaproteobacteria bacterium]
KELVENKLNTFVSALTPHLSEITTDSTSEQISGAITALKENTIEPFVEAFDEIKGTVEIATLDVNSDKDNVKTVIQTLIDNNKVIEPVEVDEEAIITENLKVGFSNITIGDTAYAPTDEEYAQGCTTVLQSFKNAIENNEKVEVTRNLLKFWYQYNKTELDVSKFAYNSITGMWTYNEQNDFNYSICGTIYYNTDLTTPNEIVINEIANEAILNINIDSTENQIIIYRYFTGEEQLFNVIKQTLQDYYSITEISDSDITNICENSRNVNQRKDSYNISYTKGSNFIELSKSDSKDVESTIDISRENYITITQCIDTPESIQEFVNKVLNSYSTTLNNGESIDSTISYNTEINLFENNEKYRNFTANDNKYAIHLEADEEAVYEDEETINQINIYPITDKILTIDTDKSASEIFDDFINNYEEAYNKVPSALQPTAISINPWEA